MKTNSHVIYMLEKAVEALEPILDRIVFTGGAVVPLYLDNFAGEYRPTEDVDCLIEIASRVEYNKLEKELRGLKLKHDISSDIIYRWKYADILIDVMPTDEKILGFTNPWYRAGMKHSENYVLPSGKKIPIFSIEYLIASKLDAFWSRGKNDILTSKDMEDIIMLLAFSSKATNCLSAKKDIFSFIAKEMKLLLDRPGFIEDISGFFLPDKKGEGKVKEVITLMNRIVVKESI
jgi:predicted nucleotidyltransferase